MIFNPSIILVRPQMGENIGAAARAMLNFGLDDLRIVAPRDGWPSQQAIDMSAGALDSMPPARIFATLAEAVADLHYVMATTARPRDMVKAVYTPAAAAAELKTRAEQKTGIVFGPERSGLENDDVALCHAVITVPVNPDFSSINIASTVLLMAYECFAGRNATAPLQKNFEPAPQETLEEMLVRLEGELQKAGFFRSPDQKPTMLRNIRAMFTRADLTEQEVRTFQGMLTALAGKK